jgi:hypothetical protein
MSEIKYTPPNEAPLAPIQPVLTGQHALVTGASKRLGQADADVLVNYNSDEVGALETKAAVERRAARRCCSKRMWGKSRKCSRGPAPSLLFRNGAECPD